MSFEGIPMKRLAIFLIAGGVLAVFAISGFQARNLFAPSVTEEAQVLIKEVDKCVVEGSDRVPRDIPNCQYNVGDTVLITYKPGQPSIETHELKQSATS
ncbi:MAG TPA: hypothetical protein VF172_10310 [Nitrososphaera sp.]|jgi:hypothetical protein